MQAAERLRKAQAAAADARERGEAAAAREAAALRAADQLRRQLQDDVTQLHVRCWVGILVILTLP